MFRWPFICMSRSDYDTLQLKLEQLKSEVKRCEREVEQKTGALTRALGQCQTYQDESRADTQFAAEQNELIETLTSNIKQLQAKNSALESKLAETATQLQSQVADAVLESKLAEKATQLQSQEADQTHQLTDIFMAVVPGKPAEQRRLATRSWTRATRVTPL